MIKIEIIDPARENPAMLVKIATLLMDLAGHAIVKAPDDFDKKMEDFEKRMIRAELTPDELPEQGHRSSDEIIKSMSLGELQQAKEILGNKLEDIGVSMPYQHCAESDLTHALGQCIESVKEANNEIKEILEKEYEKLDKARIGESGLVEVVAEKPKSATKRKRAPKFEVIKETVVEDLLPPPAPVLTPMVNGNVLVDKILVAKTQGMVTHDEITAIVRKHGLVAIKDIFINDHLIPLISSDLDELLRGK